MYDTKSRELRWNATFSDYSAPLCEESYHYSEWPPQEPAAPAPCLQWDSTPGRCCHGRQVSAVLIAGNNSYCSSSHGS